MAPLKEGAGYFQLTTRRGLRCSSAIAYLHPIRHLPNLEIATGALVSKVLLEDGRAYGIGYRQQGEAKWARAEGEVILAAGSISSPQILQLSGIGPGAWLQKVGIDVVHDLKGVGANLQDHFQVRSLYRCTAPLTLNDKVQGPIGKARIALEWILRRTGSLTIGAGQGGIFAHSHPGLEAPDVQFHLILFSADKPGAPFDRGRTRTRPHGDER